MQVENIRREEIGKDIKNEHCSLRSDNKSGNLLLFWLINIVNDNFNDVSTKVYGLDSLDVFVKMPATEKNNSYGRCSDSTTERENTKNGFIL